MKRPPLPESSCIIRLLSPPPLLLLLLLHLHLHLSGAEAAPRPTAAPSGRSPPPLPSQTRKLPTRSNRAAWLQKRLETGMFSGKAGKAQLSGKGPVVAQDGQLYLHALTPLGLDPSLLSSGHLPQPSRTTVLRRKRHAAARLHHAQLMRVGCALGTCQVQNLSHRLWQLKGQSGRQDSSPINPNSPHSYG